MAAGNDSSPAFISTPSASIITPTPLLTPTLIPTATPTASARETMPSTESGVPSSGFGDLHLLLLATGLLLLVGSYYLSHLGENHQTVFWRAKQTKNKLE